MYYYIVMNITLSIPDELATRAKAYCDAHGYKLSTFIQHLVRMKIEAVESLGVSSAPTALVGGMPEQKISTERLDKYKATAMKVDDHKDSFPEDDELEDAVAICPTCFNKRPKPVTLVTYRDSDQIRVSNKLCAECISKAKASGSFLGEGRVE